MTLSTLLSKVRMELQENIRKSEHVIENAETNEQVWTCLQCGGLLETNPDFMVSVLNEKYQIEKQNIRRGTCVDTKCKAVHIGDMSYKRGHGFQVKVINLGFPFARSENSFGFGGFCKSNARENLWFTQSFLASVLTDMVLSDYSFSSMVTKLLCLNPNGLPYSFNFLRKTLQTCILWFGYCQASMGMKGLSEEIVHYPEQIQKGEFVRMRSRNSRKSWTRVLDGQQDMQELSDPLEEPAEKLRCLLVRTSDKNCITCPNGHDTVVMDACMKRCYHSCARLYSELLECEHSGLHIMTACTNRPVKKEQYCQQHLTENMRCNLHWGKKKGCEGVLVEITDAKADVVNGRIVVEYREAGSSSFKTLEQVCIRAVRAYELKVLSQGSKKVRDRDQVEEKDLTGTCENKTKGGRLRKSGGIFVSIFGCGRIAGISEVFENESLTQATMSLSEVLNQAKQVQYVIYDYSCGLSKFIRNRTDGDNDMLKHLSELTYVIDRFHAPSHKCLKTDDGKRFLADNYDNLRDVNTECCEQIFGKLKKVCNSVSAMSRHGAMLYYVILAYYENCRLSKGLRGKALEKARSNVQKTLREMLSIRKTG